MYKSFVLGDSVAWTRYRCRLHKFRRSANAGSQRAVLDDLVEAALSTIADKKRREWVS